MVGFFICLLLSFFNAILLLIAGSRANSTISSKTSKDTLRSELISLTSNSKKVSKHTYKGFYFLFFLSFFFFFFFLGGGGKGVGLWLVNSNFYLVTNLPLLGPMPLCCQLKMYISGKLCLFQNKHKTRIFP